MINYPRELNSLPQLCLDTCTQSYWCWFQEVIVLEAPVNVISLTLQMFLLICQIYLISATSELEGYSRERRNCRTSTPPQSFLMTQKVSLSSRRMFSSSSHHPPLLEQSLFSHPSVVPWLPSCVITHNRYTAVRSGCIRKLKIDMEETQTHHELKWTCGNQWQQRQPISRKFSGYVASEFASFPPSTLPRSACGEKDFSVGELCHSGVPLSNQKGKFNRVLVLKILPTSHLPSFVTVLQHESFLSFSFTL